MKIIIYGAGKWGEYAYWEYVDKEEIICFCDNNVDLWGQVRFGTSIKVESPKIISDYSDAVVVLAIQKADEVIEELKKYKNRKIIIYKPFSIMNDYVLAKQFRLNEQLILELNHNRCLWMKDYMGAFLELNEVSFMHGGSGLLDYAFLVSTVQKFHAKTYLEIGTYIGESINCVADYCDRCYSVTASEDSPYFMDNFCKEADIPNFSNKLVYKDNIKQYKCINSRDFEYSEIQDDIDIYFIDGDHSYSGVWCDTKKVFEHKSENAIVIWHDLRNYSYTTALAIKNSIGDEKWKNVYCTDKTMCGVYIPDSLKDLVKVRPFGYQVDDDDFYTMTVSISVD